MVYFKHVCIMLSSARPTLPTSVHIEGDKVSNHAAALATCQTKYGRGIRVHVAAFDSSDGFAYTQVCTADVNVVFAKVEVLGGLKGPRHAPQRQTKSRKLCHDIIYVEHMSSGYTHAFVCCPILACFHSIALIARQNIVR